ncbi:MAG TPA: Fur family transcriptional regulator [Chthoniobacterales bacterium]
MTIPTTTFNADGILALLRSQGLRITRSRRGIVLALFQATRPSSLTEIQAQALAAGGVLPDYATVFRMMILLESLKIVHKVNLRRSCSYYELTDPSKHHDHLVCTQCGKVVTLDIGCPVAETERRIEKEYGFTGLHHSLEFFGWCPDCAPVALPIAESPVPA